MDVIILDSYFSSAGILDDSFTLDFTLDPAIMSSDFEPDFQTWNANLPPDVVHHDLNVGFGSIYDTTIFNQLSDSTLSNSKSLGKAGDASDQARQNISDEDTCRSPKSSGEASGERGSSRLFGEDAPFTVSRIAQKPGRLATYQREKIALPPKKTKRRKKKRFCKEETENKRRKFLERNRLAASKSRRKKNDWILALELRNKELMLTRSQLMTEYEGLKAEIDCLKTQLMIHKACSDGTVQRWLQME